jgi:hypothetical protein
MWAGSGFSQYLGSVVTEDVSNDTAFIPTAGRGTAARFYDGAYGNDSQSRATSGVKSPVPGVTTCSSGIAMRAVCGEVIGQPVQFRIQNAYTMVYSPLISGYEVYTRNHTAMAHRGDSGGPVFAIPIAGAGEARATLSAVYNVNVAPCPSYITDGKACAWKADTIGIYYVANAYSLQLTGF